VRILLIEDDAMVGSAVRHGMTKAGFVVDWVRGGADAKALLVDSPYELAILDLGLPDSDGMEVLRTIRRGGNKVPILIASARDTLRDKVAGLEAGADDYVLKPFDLEELIARVRAVVRRHAGSATSLLIVDNIVLDPGQRTVLQGDKPVELSGKEFALLETLMRRPGTVLSKEQLEESLYERGNEVWSNAVEVHLHRLRKKLGASVIRNVRGVGYRIEQG
jgi:two-component system, OmpR family, response regulator QseB